VEQIKYCCSGLNSFVLHWYILPPQSAQNNISGKLTDERFIKLSRDYELEQDNLKATSKILREEVKQQEKSKSNVKNFVTTAKKYTDLTELDATILREFIDKILVSKTSGKKGRRASDKVQEIEIVYNFIGAFDFGKAIEQAQINHEIAKVGIA
jgi:site-specific DNA recombinase